MKLRLPPDMVKVKLPGMLGNADTLTKLQQRIVDAYNQGKSMGQIARGLGCSKQTVSKAIHKAAGLEAAQ